MGRLGKHPRCEWTHFVDTDFNSEGTCTLVCPFPLPNLPLPLPPLAQVKCRHCSWTGSKHATRCARQYQKHHGYSLDSSCGASSSGDALSQEIATSSNASSSVRSASSHGLKQLHMTLSTHRRLNKHEQREAEYKLILLQLRYGLSLQAMSSPDSIDGIY